MQKQDINIYKKKRLPLWLKAMLVKAWFAGAVYFFVGLGLFINTTDQLDITLAIGLVSGLVTDIIANKIFIGMERKKGEWSPYMMFGKKKTFSLLLNIVYAVALSFLVASTYNFINIILININNLPKTSIVIGAEPVMFGIIYMLYDMIALQVKKLFSVKRSKAL